MSQPAQPSHPFRHSLPVQMRFNDIDALGHINNSMYMQYMDLGKTDYIDRVLGDVFDLHGESMVIVNINCTFYSITRLGEPLQVLTRVDSIAEHTFAFEQRVANIETGEVKVAAQVVMVGYDPVANCKMRIPDRWRSRIAEFEQRTY